MNHSEQKIYDEITKVKIRQGEFKVEIHEVQSDIKSIKDNHLPSIYNRIGRIEKMIWIAFGGISLAIFLIEMYVRLK